MFFCYWLAGRDELWTSFCIRDLKWWELRGGRWKMEGTAVTYLGQTVAGLGESDGCGE